MIEHAEIMRFLGCLSIATLRDEVPFKGVFTCAVVLHHMNLLHIENEPQKRAFDCIYESSLLGSFDSRLDTDMQKENNT